MGRLALTILAHVAVFAGVDLLFSQVPLVPGDTDGIATGLLAFLVLFLLAVTWGASDGRSATPGRLAVVGVITGLVSGAEMAAAIQLPPGDADLDVFVSDLATFVPFGLGLIGVPGLVGGVLVWALRPTRAAL